jgi:hypothetical protein
MKLSEDTSFLARRALRFFRMRIAIGAHLAQRFLTGTSVYTTVPLGYLPTNFLQALLLGCAVFVLDVVVKTGLLRTQSTMNSSVS